VINAVPDPNQVEVSVFGPGVGESILVHIGHGDWIVVDSCRDKKSGEPAALQYLESIGIDVGAQVKLVVATHWHDDHINGLAEILSAAKSARFVSSSAYSLNSLLSLIQLDKINPPAWSATREFDAIYKVLLARRKKGEKIQAVGPIQAGANRRLLALTGVERSIAAEVFSLSPADGVFNRAEAELAAAISNVTLRNRPGSLGPNQLCVALWLKLGDLNILLGADLEHVSGTTEGWRAILTSGERPQGKARIFKVAHHGSKTADCAECWEMLLDDQPIAVLTPYCRSSIPTDEDLRRICSKTAKAYITANPSGYASPRRDNAVEKTLREVVVHRRALSGPMGHVRVRLNGLDSSQAPEVTLANGAWQCCSKVGGIDPSPVPRPETDV
jgi:beta-lactamase superfamily II metal-dependent hydrolase